MTKQLSFGSKQQSTRQIPVTAHAGVHTNKQVFPSQVERINIAKHKVIDATKPPLLTTFPFTSETTEQRYLLSNNELYTSVIGFRLCVVDDQGCSVSVRQTLVLQ